MPVEPGSPSPHAASRRSAGDDNRSGASCRSAGDDNGAHRSAAQSNLSSFYGDWLIYGACVIVGGVLATISNAFPADLPSWMPWEFSWPVYLATALALAWFFCGLSRLAPEERPALWRSAAFVIGVLGNYVVLQTHIDYLAQHMFFVHRWAHFWLHHAGGFLIALGMSGPVLRAGMPGFLIPVIDSAPVQRTLDILQHKAVAPLLFVGLLYFWLIPALHTPVMLDRRLYEVMNWTMAINGFMFWSLIVDPRPHPPARYSTLWRALAIIIIELPQMVLGAILSLAETDYYPVYDICGRVFDMTALSDQHYGGLIIWLPGTMMSFAAMIIVLTVMRRNEEAEERRIGSRQ